MLGKVVNHKGVAADCSYAVWAAQGHERLIYAFDAIGPETAVKAVFATMVGNATKLEVLTQKRTPGLVFKDSAVSYGCHKETLLQHPALFRWHFFPQITPDDPYVVCYAFRREEQEPLTPGTEWYEDAPLQAHFHQVLEQHTIWPCRRAWAGALLQHGYAHRRVVPLKHTANLHYAYLISVNGWDAVLQEALDKGALAFPSWEPAPDASWGQGRRQSAPVPAH